MNPSLRAVVHAEGLKLWKSWALLVAVLAPLTQAGFLFIVFWFSENRVREFGTGFQAWYHVQHTVWNSFFLPVSIALMGAMTWGQEVESAAWKHLLSQPLPRWAHYLGKVGGLLGLGLLAQATFCLALIGGGLLLRVMAPQLQMGPVEFLRLGAFTSLSLLAALPLALLHAWFGSRSARVNSALVVAVGGIWIATQLPASNEHSLLWPWATALRLSGWVHFGKPLPGGLFLSLPLSMALLGLGLWDFSRRPEVTP